MKRTAELMFGGSEADADLLYASGFVAGDPFPWLRIGGRSVLIVSDLELDRARAEASVDEIVSLGEVGKALGRRDGRRPTWLEAVEWRLRRGRARDLDVPSKFPLGMAEQLRARGFRVRAREGTFLPERASKRPDEIRAIEETQRATEEAVEAAFELLRRSKRRGARLFHRGRLVTSELLRGVVHRELMDRDCTAVRTIIAGGDQGCVPHAVGTGPIAPDRSIVFDVFPRSNRTHYWADMSRTVVKGRASDGLKRMYDAVLEAQLAGIRAVRPGVDGTAVHERTRRTLEARGFRTGMRRGRMVGYFHGTGHGVGLEIHEAPWLVARGTRIVENAVVTVEPGLYYPGTGAVRLEDMVLASSKGPRNLTRFPKQLEL